VHEKIAKCCCSPIASPSACCSPIVTTSAAAPRLCPLQLLLPDCVCFSCCSSTASSSAAAPRVHASACYHTHTVQSIISTKVAHHYCSPTPQISHFFYTHTHSSDSRCSKFLLKSAGPSHHQTSVSIHQIKLLVSSIKQ